MENSFSLLSVESTDKNLSYIGRKKHEVNHNKKGKTLYNLKMYHFDWVLYKRPRSQCG